MMEFLNAYGRYVLLLIVLGVGVAFATTDWGQQIIKDIVAEIIG